MIIFGFSGEGEDSDDDSDKDNADNTPSSANEPKNDDSGVENEQFKAPVGIPTRKFSVKTDHKASQPCEVLDGSRAEGKVKVGLLLIKFHIHFSFLTLFPSVYRVIAIPK